MKKLTLLLLVIIALMACNNQNKKISETAENQKNIVGVDKDEHDCNRAAGQTWSELKQNCIQVFNEATRLNPIDSKAEEAVISCFVLFNDDKSKVELFLPQNESNSIILIKSDNEKYGYDIYTFDAKELVLYINGEKKYKAES